MLYVDTSVLVAALTPEDRSADIQHWLSAQEAAELHVSDWVVTEFSSALSIKVREGALTPEHRAEVLAVFTAVVDESFTVLPVSRDDFRTAARFADQVDAGVRAGDALHLAIAGGHGATLCTLDRKLLSAAPFLAVSAMSP